MSARKIKKKPNAPKTRKQLRKEQRKNKKIKRHEYYTNRRKPGQFVLLNRNNTEEAKEEQLTKNRKEKSNFKSKLEAEKMRETEKKKQVALQKEMNKRRKKQLVEANLEEDRTIKHLEKQLKLNKRKSKGVPASFSVDGLDYLLEVCDPENLESSALAEQQLAEVNDEFEEDLVLMTEGGATNTHKNVGDESDDESSEVIKKSSKSKKRTNKNKRNDHKKSKKSAINLDEDIDSNNSSFDDDSNIDESSVVNNEFSKSKKTTSKNDHQRSNKNENKLENDVDMDDSSFNNDSDFDDIGEIHDSDDHVNINHNSDDDDDSVEVDSDDDHSVESDSVKSDTSQKKNDDGTWEDIYGRTRSSDGSIVTTNNKKYIPPAARMNLEGASIDKMRLQKLDRLKKQLKGLLNRLAESNIHNISTQIEELYRNNSRNDMNNTITSLVMEALVSNILAPERLLMEHVFLIAILHANVGSEVGAHFLQTVVKQLDLCLKDSNNENKKLDNIVIILAQLYNFKMFDSKLIFEILAKLAEKFDEKHVECILHVLRNVGFNLRKDNPIALKNLILSLQKQASNVSDDLKDNSRVKFMLDVLLAIKNNNVSKIPNYDTSYSEHLKKIMKGFVRKGNYVTQLNISLEDLLKAEQKGKWWVVGSAWSGNNTDGTNLDESKEKPHSFSQKLLDLAAKQRMNTDTRRNIFCIIMSAEDYLDAFEKLLRLALKNQQEREIIHVILHCCLQEKNYNPYYATLSQKFCEYDRKYQMTIKYSIWDKLKTLKEHSATQISNLAKLLSFLFMEKGLPITTLKVVQFSELDKVTLRFIRQILLGILLHDDLDACKGVFEKVCYSDKLKMFRESLKLFLYHFLLKNLDSQGISNDKKELLQRRVKVVEQLLTGKEIKLRS